MLAYPMPPYKKARINIPALNVFTTNNLRLTGKDNDKPTQSEKAAVFEIWLNDYLFVDKLGIEYGGDNWYKKEYYSNSAM
jgi:hypothetical protein